MSVGPSVGVNKFQELLIAYKVHELIMFECILFSIMLVTCILCTIHVMHKDLLAAIAALYMAMYVCWSVGVYEFHGVKNIYISHN